MLVQQYCYYREPLIESVSLLLTLPATANGWHRIRQWLQHLIWIIFDYFSSIPYFHRKKPMERSHCLSNFAVSLCSQIITSGAWRYRSWRPGSSTTDCPSCGQRATDSWWCGRLTLTTPDSDNPGSSSASFGIWSVLGRWTWSCHNAEAVWLLGRSARRLVVYSTMAVSLVSFEQQTPWASWSDWSLKGKILRCF